MSKLSFRARALDAGKPMPIYMAEELPDLPDFSAINRAVPQMPSGMQKEEECEHHLQRAIVAGLIIPTPEVSELSNRDFYEKIYPSNYKQPRQLIHMQPFTMEQDIPDYDMDSEDERWLQSQTQKLDLSPMKFEEMMDRLEKSSGQTVVTLNEAKALLKEDDDLIIAVFDYWLNKRLKTQHPLILTVKTEHRSGTAANNPYLAFRRRTEKMQTRKNRKNDEASYEKMLKLRRDLLRAVTLLELVKRREKIKREHVHLTVEVFEKRYQARDFSGSIINEASAVRSTRPAFTPIFQNHYTNQGWSNKATLKDEVLPRREKRQYKKRKHKSLGSGRSMGSGGLDSMGGLSSDEDSTVPQLSPETDDVDDEGQFAFRRNKSCSYHMPLPHEGNWPWCSREEHGFADKRYRFTLTSLSNPRRCVGYARRRVGRGGRVILDRLSMDRDDFWRTLDFSIIETNKDSDSSEIVNDYGGRAVGGDGDRTNDATVTVKREPPDESATTTDALATMGVPGRSEDEQDDMVEFLRSIRRDWLHFRPKTPPQDYEPPCDMLLSQDTFFAPGGAPFSMEIQPLEPLTNGLLLDGTSPSYVTDPFVFEQHTPVTDTRQHTLTTTTTTPSGVGFGNDEDRTIRNKLTTTTTPSGFGFGNDEDRTIRNKLTTTPSGVGFSNDGVEDRTIIGCSSFSVACADRGVSQRPYRQRAEKGEGSNGVVSVTGGVSTGPKLNSANVTTTTEESRQGRRHQQDGGGQVGNTNGLLAQFGFEVPSNKSRNNKLSYAYSGAVGYPKASPGTLSLHTSAHTVTLNSHSANLLDLPITDDDEGSKLASAPAAPPSVPTNNKTKTIVRKNNIIMEVT